MHSVGYLVLGMVQLRLPTRTPSYSSHISRGATYLHKVFLHKCAARETDGPSMVLSSTTTALYAGGLTLAWWLYGLIQDRINNPNRLPLPPGPRGYPIIDCLLQFPARYPWLVYDEWFKVYGAPLV